MTLFLLAKHNIYPSFYLMSMQDKELKDDFDETEKVATECELDNGHRPAAGDSRHTSSGGANMPSATSNATITDTLDLTETEALPKETNQSILFGYMLLFFITYFASQNSLC